MRGRTPFVVVAFAIVALVSVVVFAQVSRVNSATGVTSTAAALATNDPTIVALTTAFAGKQIPLTTQQAVNSTIKAGVRSFTPVGGTLPPTSNAQTQTAVAKPLPTCTTANTPPPLVFDTAVPGNANDSKLRTAQVQGATAINAPADERHVARQTIDLAPQVPREQKNDVWVRHIDCIYDVYLMTNDQIDGFRRSLPTGDLITSIGGPAQDYGFHPPPRITPGPNRTVVGLTPSVGSSSATAQTSPAMPRP